MFTLGRKVVVIGNGFDLSSGLKSKYSDFFSKRINIELQDLIKRAFKHFKIELYDKHYYKTLFNVKEPEAKFDFVSVINEYEVAKIYNELPKSNLTFWDLIFCLFDDGSNDLQWQDVERRMLEFLNTPEELVDVPSLDMILALFDDKSSIKANAKTLFCLHLALWLSDNEDRIKYDRKDVINYLYDELRLFEKAFSEYIKSIEDDEYYRAACKLLLEITKVFSNKDEEHSVPEIEDLIFTFNYTNPFNVYGPNIPVVNVHGTAEDNKIIFGIDQEKIDPNKSIFRFTKTFRQMTETKLASNYEQAILLSKDEVSEIAFYGHSLSELDYSYFQTIFDHYDLYGGNILLVFYYKVYEGTTQEALELDLADKISRLLHNYSDSIDNSKKGKNLLHKLLLEKRLIIKEVRYQQTQY
ncbi:AbiH family protein [Enterococcus faecalis]|uniref:AbiH family protein n=1 Tax=Enterococcus faecalis TaxID=1351 RepID=UPI00046C6E6E|nr:AbiH family protein [Enterococcus faecalis]MDQ6109747.1 bacteriophage abortive infection AbiH family protein [Enterococcus faecalis]MDQ6186296.1 bacteriophage abortive infection AbiH family protein [Enterococcus faecalis]MDQ6225208.1 bacteriophage abortive infection AbiH family protein [Enterococcus faecalis]MEB7428278.1 bacteriophage abortive infection AbiH family protein [Enterococcus faecalis]